MIDALEAAAQASLPGEVYEYYRAGAGREITLAEQEAAWSSVRLRPRVLNGVGTVDTRARLLGIACDMPIAVAPTALHVLANPEGEVATAAAAGQRGALMVLSMRSGRRLSDVAEVAGPWWQQIYVTKDRRISDVVAERAAAGRAQALVLTVDTPVVARKAIPIPQTSVPTRLLPELELADERIEQAPDVGLSDIQRLASVSGLPVVVKGVLRGDDARRCVDAGAAGVIVSGHGGRQLDQVISVPSALPEVVAAVGSDVEVFADGGVRRGVDVVIALALGARAVFLGRPVLWALAAGGSNRVGQLLDDLRGEFAEAMLLAGCGSVTEVSSDLVER